MTRITPTCFWQFQVKVIVDFLIIFKALMDTLFIIKVKIIVLTKWL